MKEKNCVAIIGGGPAGLTAALYLGRAHVPCVVFDTDVCGGQLPASPVLEKVPGFYGPGVDLAMKMLDEINKYPSIELANFTKVIKVKPISDNEQLLTLEDGAKMRFQYVICATGSNPIKLPQLESKNTHYCVTCDGPLYEGKTVAVIGGGNTALQYALELTKYADKIYVCTNEDSLRGEEIMRERVLNEPKIEIRTNFTAASFDGKVLEQANGPSLTVDGIFVAIGYRTNTDYIDAITSEGRLLTDINLNILSFNLSTTHIFAVGDCRYKPFNQVIIAMSEGCQAALSIIRDLEK